MEKGQRYVMQSHTLQDALDIFNDMIQGEPSFAEVCDGFDCDELQTSLQGMTPILKLLNQT